MLNSVEYLAYIARTIALCRTFVIKCEDQAILDNRLMEGHGIYSGNDKTKWRYYLNLNGEYHSTDEMMKVQSLDNGEVIDFTKANLDLHPATKRAYRQGSYYYTRLVDKYQGQRELINGIINPIPPSESIPAKDYQILRYNQDYVLWNEYQLIPALQAHIYNMVETSFRTEYLLTDNLMLTALLGNLYGSLIPAILQIRKEAEGTRYAHEFYIWARLTSLGLSTIYKDVLDRHQTMWLYRNLDYVLRLQGRRQTFDELVDVILTRRSIPLARYEVLQTTTDQLETLTPSPRLISKPVNLANEFGMSTKLWTVEEVVRKELPLALDNERNQEMDNEITDYAIRYDMTSKIPTKVLESTMVDATDRNPQSIMKVLHNHWLYLTANDLYVINHDFVDLRTGRHFRLNTKQAYILWCYLIDQYNGFPREDIPYYDYYDVRKITPPTYQTLMSLGHREILTEELCKDILNVNVVFPRLVSPDGFFAKVKEAFDQIWEHKKLYLHINNLFIQSRTKNAVEALYETGCVKLTETKTYQAFLAENDLSFSDYGKEDLLDLAWGIWKKVTGWENVNYITVGDQQRTLINLMADLTSYTVQYIGSTESNNGHYQLAFPLQVDTDIWPVNGDTALESDNKDLHVPVHFKGVVEPQLFASSRPHSVEGNLIHHIEGLSEGRSDLTLSMNLYDDTSPDTMMPCMIRTGLIVRPDPSNWSE